MRYYRWVFGMLGAYVIGVVVLVIVLLLSITDANAGYPALFFGGILLATVPPAGVACAILAAVSLLRHEAHRAAMIGVLVVSCLLAWQFRGVFFRLVTAIPTFLP